MKIFAGRDCAARAAPRETPEVARNFSRRKKTA